MRTPPRLGGLPPPIRPSLLTLSASFLKSWAAVCSFDVDRLLFQHLTTSLSFKALLTRRPLLFAPQMGSFLHGMPSKGMAAVLFLSAVMRERVMEGRG